ncbi:MAG: transglycosylase domain-containing protein [Aggregatilineales bacterium]
MAGVGILGSAFVALIVSIITLVIVYFYVGRDLPSPDAILKARQQFETTLIYDRTGQTVLYQVIDPNAGDRQWSAIGDIPANLIHATVAIEDKRFFDNPGFDVRGITRALLITLNGDGIQGGSTITQQLVKNTLIAPDERTSPSIWRKIKEVILAAEISARYSKAEILELYLNSNFYGNLAYGINAASKVYFNKPVQNLTLGEAALLAAIPQNPQLNPLDNWQAARTRQVVVLDLMAQQGYITSDQAQQAASEPIVVAPLSDHLNLIAPHFALYARQQAEQLLDAQGLNGELLVARGGLHIYTTLDLDLQYQAECVARSYIARLTGADPNTALNTSAGTPCKSAADLPAPPSSFKLGVNRNVTNAAIVALKPTTGEMLAMVGSLDFWNPGIDGNYNVAIGQRQPGSTFKIFTYAGAFASGKFTPATMLLDVPTSFSTGGGPIYQPTNEDDTFHGAVSLRDAFANSYNIPAVSVLEQVGVGNVIRTAHLLGINSLNNDLTQYGLSLTLGSNEVSLVDLTYAYSVFANMGVMAGTPVQDPRPGYRQLNPVAILRIDDSGGHTLWQFDEHSPTFGTRSVVEPGLAYLVNNILSDSEARVPAFGKGNALELNRLAAAKTGTTNDNRDAWTVGYTPQLAMGVWVGNNNNTPMGNDVLGITGAGPIWHALMQYRHDRDALPVQNWPRPSTIVDAVVCKISGLLPTPDCPRTHELFYVNGSQSTLPQQTDTYYKRLTINTRNGLIATTSTPIGFRADKLFFDYPPQAQQWARAAGLPLPPTEFDTGGASTAPTGVALNKPAALSRIHGALDISGDITAPNEQSYTLAYGAGLNPHDWINITANGMAHGQGITLGRWDASNLDGLYTVRLQVILTDRSVLEATVQVTVDNVPPTVTLTAPQPGTTFSGSTVELVANASDNLPDGMYVEFYHNDKLIDTVKQTPFTTTWKIDSNGPQTFYAIAYDSAGNSAKSTPITVTTSGQ